ncbi:AI-2E family transporter [Rickettsia endosymbiont of Culicoides newsteadi]|uniref:AI-2E family transporter n=1 Tax=Rickettsia endosymbiont of Culicoides newsteadi TaxID=1961830 RepID=UPI000B9ABAE6|nr:AI-2E family transporter [Rickettsia endosymbiont of Culicoides newsteadi]OZG31290.1 AI-2E family transporter [Rickettsia endosymbiont of Culicoides newsteadi]
MDKTIFWVIVVGTIIVTLTLISNILMPFFIAGIISYILQPIIDNLSLRYKLSRTIVVSVISFLFFSIFAIVMVVLLPIIYQQTTLLISKIPAYKDYLQTELIPVITAKFYSIDPDIADNIKNSISNFVNGIFLLITGLANNIWHVTMVTINLFVLILLIPLILFYFLRDWLTMSENINLLLPLKGKKKILKILSAINTSLSAYIRGQLNVCLLLSIYYGVSLSILGVDLGLLLGVLSGFSIIIPFVGILISFSLTMIVSYFAFGMVSTLFYIIIIYLVGTIVEGYILSPKIIGDKIGLHPLWIIFAVLALGNIFGFLGILFAIPIASIIKVLFLAAIDFYKSSKFYKS